MLTGYCGNRWHSASLHIDCVCCQKEVKAEDRERERKDKDGEIGSKTREKGSKAARTKLSLGEAEGRRCERLG